MSLLRTRPIHLLTLPRASPFIVRSFASLSEPHLDPENRYTMSALLNALNPVKAMMTPPYTPKEDRSREASRELTSSFLLDPAEIIATRKVNSKTIPQPSAEQNLLRLQNHMSTLPTPLLKHMHLSKVRREDPRLFFQAMAADLTNL